MNVRSITITLFVLMGTSTAAMTDPIDIQEGCWLGIYADPGGLHTELSLPTGQTTPAYLILHTTGFEIGVVAAAFRVENWPESVGFPWGVALVDWVGDTISSGSIEEGITILPVGDSIPWVPDENGNILIATIYFTVLDPDWIGAETILSINDDLHDHFDEPVFLSDVDYHIYGMLGDSIFLHTDLWLATATTTFSELKALY